MVDKRSSNNPLNSGLGMDQSGDIEQSLVQQQLLELQIKIFDLMNGLSGEIADLREGHRSLYVEFRSLQKTVESQGDCVQKIKAETDDIDANVKSLRGDVSGVSDQIQAMQNDITPVRDLYKESLVIWGFSKNAFLGIVAVTGLILSLLGIAQFFWSGD